MQALFYCLALIDDHRYDDKFTEIYYKYEKRVFTIAYKYTEDRYDAEEAAQNAFMTIARNIDKINLDDEAKTKIYIYKCAKSASIDLLRAKNKKIKALNIDYYGYIPSSENISERVEREEEIHRLKRIILELPSECRDALTYRFLFGCSAREIADIMKKPLSTVKSQIKRGGEHIKDALKKGSFDE